MKKICDIKIKRPDIADFGCEIEVAVPNSAISSGRDQSMPPERISARFA